MSVPPWSAAQVANLAAAVTVPADPGLAGEVDQNPTTPVAVRAIVYLGIAFDHGASFTFIKSNTMGIVLAL